MKPFEQLNRNFCSQCARVCHQESLEAGAVLSAGCRGVPLPSAALRVPGCIPAPVPGQAPAGGRTDGRSRRAQGKHPGNASGGRELGREPRAPAAKLWAPARGPACGSGFGGGGRVGAGRGSRRLAAASPRRWRWGPFRWPARSCSALPPLLTRPARARRDVRFAPLPEGPLRLPVVVRIVWVLGTFPVRSFTCWAWTGRGGEGRLLCLA